MSGKPDKSIPTVDVIVLTWNQKRVIECFVESFLQHTSVPCRLFIIDQGSCDGTPEYLRSLKGGASCAIIPVFNMENKGFIGGMNQGMAMSDADYVCLANNDLLFTEGWLEELIRIFESNPRIGVLNPNSNNLNLSPAPGQSIDDLAAQNRKKYAGVFTEMPFCIGFCMVIRRETIRRAGFLSTYLDSIFFDDTDYSMKAVKNGFLIGVARGAYVWHMEHASFTQMGPRRQAYMDKNLRLFEQKWGRILRICLIVRDAGGLMDALRRGVRLSRRGNYVHIYTAFPTGSREEVFRDHGITEHAGVQIVNRRGLAAIAWNGLVKRKKFHLAVGMPWWAAVPLRLAGTAALMAWDQETYARVKFMALGQRG